MSSAAFAASVELSLKLATDHHYNQSFSSNVSESDEAVPVSDVRNEHVER